MAYEPAASETFAAPRDNAWATFGLTDDVLPFIGRLLESNELGALATLVRAEGASPRPIGAQMAIGLDGAMCGYVSGGCVEANVGLIGREVAKENLPRMVRFGAGSPFMDVRLPCGGAIELLIEPLRSSDDSLHAILQARADRQSIVRTVSLSGQTWTEAPRPFAARAGVSESGEAWRRYDPPTRLIILGHDPTALAIAQIAGAMGLEVTLVRAMGPHDPPDRPACRYLRCGPKEAFDTLHLDCWTAVVTTTHDLSQDHEALLYALPSDAFYVGALGSRRRLRDRVEKLQSAGLELQAISRLRSPVGLDIGAATPFEIAIAVIAEIVQCLRAGSPAKEPIETYPLRIEDDPAFVDINAG